MDKIWVFKIFATGGEFLVDNWVQIKVEVLDELWTTDYNANDDRTTMRI